MVEVSPGNIREFGKRMDELAEYWNDPNSSMVKFTKLKDEAPNEYPFYGSEFEAGTTVQQEYDGTYAKMATLVADAYEVMKGMAAASEKIARKYETSEERASANVNEINKIIGNYVTPKDGRAPGQDGSSGPGTDGSR